MGRRRRSVRLKSHFERFKMRTPIPEEDHAFRYLVKTVIETLPTFDDKFRKEFPVVAAEDLRIVPLSVQENIIRAVFFEHHVARQWNLAWNPYYEEMAISNRNYILMVLYSCLTAYYHDDKVPFYDRFLDIFGLVSAVSLVFSLKVDYHVYAAPILMVFFEHFMRIDFYAAGGWAGLDEYLKGLNFLDWYSLKDDLKYRDVKKPFLEAVAFWRNKKSYQEEIRFVDPVFAFTEEHSNRMADKVLTLDVTVCDRPDELTAESLLANETISQVRGSLLERMRPLTVSLEEKESFDLKVQGEVEMKLTSLRKQIIFEESMLKAARALYKGIKEQLKEAEKVAVTLTQLYDS